MNGLPPEGSSQPDQDSADNAPSSAAQAHSTHLLPAAIPSAASRQSNTAHRGASSDEAFAEGSQANMAAIVATHPLNIPYPSQHVYGTPSSAIHQQPLFHAPVVHIAQQQYNPPYAGASQAGHWPQSLQSQWSADLLSPPHRPSSGPASPSRSGSSTSATVTSQSYSTDSSQPFPLAPVLGQPLTSENQVWRDTRRSATQPVSPTGSNAPSDHDGADQPSPELSQSFYDPHQVKHRRRTSPHQLEVLSAQFAIHPKPDMATRKRLSAELNMTVREVQVWFQNRRAKQKKIDARLAEHREADAHSSGSDQALTGALRVGSSHYAHAPNVTGPFGPTLRNHLGGAVSAVARPQLAPILPLDARSGSTAPLSAGLLQHTAMKYAATQGPYGYNGASLQMGSGQSSRTSSAGEASIATSRGVRPLSEISTTSNTYGNSEDDSAGSYTPLTPIGPIAYGVPSSTPPMYFASAPRSASGPGAHHLNYDASVGIDPTDRVTYREESAASAAEPAAQYASQIRSQRISPQFGQQYSTRGQASLPTFAGSEAHSIGPDQSARRHSISSGPLRSVSGSGSGLYGTDSGYGYAADMDANHPHLWSQSRSLTSTSEWLRKPHEASSGLPAAIASSGVPSAHWSSHFPSTGAVGDMYSRRPSSVLLDPIAEQPDKHFTQSAHTHAAHANSNDGTPFAFAPLWDEDTPASAPSTMTNFPLGVHTDGNPEPRRESGSPTGSGGAGRATRRSRSSSNLYAPYPTTS